MYKYANRIIALCFFFCADTSSSNITVRGSYQYKNIGIAVSFTHSFVFTVKIANDAYIALTTFKDVYDGDIYEIVIGGENKWSAIR